MCNLNASTDFRTYFNENKRCELWHCTTNENLPKKFLMKNFIVCAVWKKLSPNRVNLSCEVWNSLHRSSRPEVFCKKGILKKFSEFTGKHQCQSLFFNKVAGKKRLWYRCFPVNFGNTFLYRTPPVAASVFIWKQELLTIFTKKKKERITGVWQSPRI